MTTEAVDLPSEPVGDYSNLMNEIRQMQQSSGAKLVAVSAAACDGLILRTMDVAASFDDVQLARFQRFAPFIVEAELGRTAVTDACLDTIRTFTHLRALHLEGTAVTGKNLEQLSTLLAPYLLEPERNQGHQQRTGSINEDAQLAPHLLVRYAWGISLDWREYQS
jgi:hypothetical protein